MRRMTWLMLLMAGVLLVGGEWALGDAAPANGVEGTDVGDALDEAAVGEAFEEAQVAPLAQRVREQLDAVWVELSGHWETGGITMWALAGLALVAVVFVIERLVNLRRGRIAPRGLADRANALWQEGEYYQVAQLARRSGSTLGRVIAFLAAHRNNSYEHLTAAAEDIAGRDFEQHNRGSYPLAAVGTLAPLLGLLGTVFGLLGAFSTIGAIGSMDDPSALAGDIGRALITTAAGLILAIPTLILYHYFTSRTTQQANILGEEVSALMQEWFLQKSDLSPQPAAKVPAVPVRKEAADARQA